MKKYLKILGVILGLFIATGFIVFICLIVWLTRISGDLGDFILYRNQITGASGSEKNYLILFQNNYELRPTGGFISSVGLVKFKNGWFDSFTIKDVYQYGEKAPYVQPPYPMQQILAPNNKDFSFTFRDGNFYPDLADSVKVMDQLWNVAGNSDKIDGVITVNFSFLEQLIDVTDSIKVNGYIFDRSSLFENIEFTVNNIDRHSIDDLKQRKDILKTIASELIKKVFYNPSAWEAVFARIKESLDKKDIQMYFADSTLNEFVKNRGWAGQWPVPVGDFLAINEANLSTFKVNRYVTKNVNYSVKFTENNAGQLVGDAKLTVTINHYGSNNIPMSGTYSGYLRTYVPFGSRLVSNLADIIRSEDKNHYFAILGKIFKIPSHSSQTITYIYTLPANVISDNNYKLYVPKQSGTNDFYSIHVELPEKYRIKSDSFTARENTAIYEGMLSNDLDLSLSFEPEKYPPYIIFQEIVSRDEIKLMFNEHIDIPSVLDKNNYFLTDKNVKNQQTDKLKITEIINEPSDNAVIIKVSGLTEQWEEHYNLKITNLKDQNGNIIQPAEKNLTLVQRVKNGRWIEPTWL